MNGPIDAELLGRLLDEHGAALALYAAQWTTAADDCVQEAFVELARQASQPQHVVAWLFRVVKHRALNASRSERRRRAREQSAVARRLQQSSSGAFSRWDVFGVVDALEQLEPEERELVVMRIWGSLSYEEIAAVLSRSTSDVHRRYHKALTNLRQILEPPCPTSSNPTNIGCQPN